MKKPLLFVVSIIFIAIGGFALGRFTAPVDEIPEAEIDLQLKANVDLEQEKMIQNLRLQLAALREREADLQARLTDNATEEQPEEPVEQAEQPEPPRREGPPRNPADMMARLEQLRESDPERYEQIMQWRENMIQQMQDRENYFASVDTRLLTREQRAVHEEFLQKLGEFNELRERMESGEGSFQEMRDAGRHLNELRETERDILLQAAGRSAGYNREDSAKFAETIKQIYQSTEIPRGGGGFGGGPGGGRRR